jgi:regulator of cell morphogenesis and NO signaling
MSITLESIVGDIATAYPLSTRVFQRHNIDFCCGGGQSIAAVCLDQGLNTDTILAEINSEVTDTAEPAIRWDEAPLDQLIQHILDVHHAPLAEELARLELLAHKVHRVHYDKAPALFEELLALVIGIKAEIIPHMQKEELMLFPMIINGQGAMAGGPISVMESDHEGLGVTLKRMRELTNDYQVPAEACNTWMALWHGLAALEEDLHQHIHLENNILFPRALQA